MTTRLDDRALGYFRIALCAAWLWTLMVRLQDLSAHYTDDGVLPRELLAASPWKFSVNMWTGTLHGQAAIFGLALVSAILCMLNIRPALTAFLSWIFAISIFSRNELVTNGADHYLGMLLLWNIFFCLPRFRSAAVFYFVLQIGALYLFTGLAKAQWPAWRDGTAMTDVLNLDILTRPWSQTLTSHGILMSAMTWLTLVIELAAPAGLVAGFKFPRARKVTLGILAVMHLSILAMLKLYLIPVMSLVSLIPFAHSAKPDGAVYRPAWFLLGLLFTLQIWTNVFPSPDVVRAFRLDQDWSFYAPPPYPGFDGWWVAEGLAENGNPVDAWQGRTESPSLDKPVPLSDYYPNQHWTAYFINGATPENQSLLQGLLPWLCRRWNGDMSHPPIKEVELHRYFSIFDQNPTREFSLRSECPKL